jgi:DNA-binding transcriptional ArsR family regulator
VSSTPSPFLTRAGEASMQIGRRLIAAEPGDRLPTVSQLAGELGTGVGTVQRALAILTGSGLVELDPRGKRGTYVRAVDRPGLWRASGQGLLIGLMPLPYTRRYEGLATGLRAELERLAVPFSLAFMSGSRVRMEAMGSGQQFAVVSRLSAERALAEKRPITVCGDFGPGSYVGRHALVWATRARRRKPRIGIDLNSDDQVELARREFGDGAEYIDVPYLQVLEHLRARRFDVTIWATDALEAADDLTVAEFTSPSAREALALSTSAAVVAAPRTLAVALLERELRGDVITSIQQQVLAGERVPSY